MITIKENDWILFKKWNNEVEFETIGEEAKRRGEIHNRAPYYVPEFKSYSSSIAQVKSTDFPFESFQVNRCVFNFSFAHVEENLSDKYNVIPVEGGKLYTNFTLSEKDRLYIQECLSMGVNRMIAGFYTLAKTYNGDFVIVDSVNKTDWLACLGNKIFFTGYVLQPKSNICTSATGWSVSAKRTPECPRCLGIDVAFTFEADNPCPSCGYPGFIPRNDVCDHKKLRVRYDGNYECMDCPALFSQDYSDLSMTEVVKLRPNTKVERSMTVCGYTAIKKVGNNKFVVDVPLDNTGTYNYVFLSPVNTQAKPPIKGYGFTIKKDY